MLLNVLLEYYCNRFFETLGEVAYRKQRTIPAVLKWIMILLPFCIETSVYYVMSHPEVFTESMIQLAKMAGLTCIFLTRQCLFETGLWGTIVTISILDFLVGICMIIRYGIMDSLGMSMYYTSGQFQIVPLLLLVIIMTSIYIPMMKWLSRFRNYFEYPGPVLKCMGLLYTVPTYVTMRPPEILNLRSSNGFLLAASFVMLSVLILGWVFFAGLRHQMQKENEFLNFHNTLFQEHTALLQEQQEFVKMSRDYLNNMQKLSEKFEVDDSIFFEIENGKREQGVLQLAIFNKQKQCEKMEIPVRFYMNELYGTGFEEKVQLLTIFYNLLDNAIEAAGKCEQGHRYIEVRGHVDANGIYLFVENTRSLRRQKKGALFSEEKKHQGLGLKIVRDIVRHHHGTMAVEKGKEDFRVKIFLPNDME